MFTKLEAVNLILDAIGESPVSSLTSGLPDAAKAERFLDRVSKEIQEKGWHCNTDTDYTFARDEFLRIPVPQNVLRIDTAGRDRSFDVTTRKLNGTTFLYDKTRKVFTFPRNLRCDVVWLFDYSELTPQLRAYIAWKAAESYQKSEMGSVALDRFIATGVAESWAALQDAEAETEDANPLIDSPSCAWITARNNKLYGN